MEGVKKWTARAIAAGTAVGLAATVVAPYCAIAAPVQSATGTTHTTGIARAAMSVSLRIEEVCSINSSTERAAPDGPQVQCQFNAPYSTQLSASTPPSPSSSTSSASSTSTSPSTNINANTIAAANVLINSPSSTANAAQKTTSSTSSNNPLSVWIVTF